MTIAFDASSGTTRLGTANPSLWSHTPVGTPKGVVVAITQMPFSTDWVSGVSYGGVDLSRVVRATDVNSEKGAADLWYRGSGIPTGAVNISVSLTSATTTKMHLVGMTVTAAGDTEVVDFDSINGDTTDPSVTLQYSSRTCMAFAAEYSGTATPTNFTANSNCTVVAGVDFDPASSIVLRQTTPGFADFAIGGTLALEDSAYVAMAIGEVATTESTGTVVHVESSAFTVASDNTGGVIAIPVTTQSGDDLYCFITSRDHHSGLAYPTCTDNDTGGNTFANIGATPSRKGTIYWKKATSATAGKSITIAGATGACAAGVSVYRNALATENPISNLVFSSALSLNPVVAGFTPDEPNSMICIAVFNYDQDDSISAISCSSPPGSLSIRVESLSNGTKDCAMIHASSLQTTGLAGTGNFTWVQPAHGNYAATFAIRSSTTTVASGSTASNSGTTQNPVHTYAGAGTYIVQLIVTDNDGNRSSASTRSVTVS